MRDRSSFFRRISYILLAIVLIGFSPTFFLRAFFEVPVIPSYVYAHGAALTLWFIWLCLQTTLATGGRVTLHRRLGPSGIAIGALVVVSGAAVSMGLAPRLLAKFGNIDSDMPRIVATVWGSIGMLVAFTGLLVAAVVFRQKADIHKRLMLLASISISLPALSRIAQFPVVDLPAPIFSFLGILTLLAILVIFDKMHTNGIHRVTWVGSSAMLATLILFGFVISNTEFARTSVLAFN